MDHVSEGRADSRLVARMADRREGSGVGREKAGHQQLVDVFRLMGREVLAGGKSANSRNQHVARLQEH
jgi:hypothetical protein